MKETYSFRCLYPFVSSQLLSYLLLLYMKLESHLSVCLSEFLCHRANLAASASIITGLAPSKSCIFWNMQDYAYNFTRMIVFLIPECLSRLCRLQKP